MPRLRLTKTVIDKAVAQECNYELRDTEAPGFLCKVTTTGRRVFMLQYRTLGGERRKPSIGLFGELTVEQARAIAQRWLAQVREGKDPSLAKRRARLNPTVKELCQEFIERHAIPHNPLARQAAEHPRRTRLISDMACEIRRKRAGRRVVGHPFRGERAIVPT